MICFGAFPVLLGLVTMVFNGWFGAPFGGPNLSRLVPTIEAPSKIITITNITNLVEQAPAPRVPVVPVPTVTVTITAPALAPTVTITETASDYITPSKMILATTTPYAMALPVAKTPPAGSSSHPSPNEAPPSSMLVRAQAFGVWVMQPTFSVFDLMTFLFVVFEACTGLFLFLYIFLRRTLTMAFFNEYLRPWFSLTYIKQRLCFWVKRLWLWVNAPCLLYEKEMYYWHICDRTPPLWCPLGIFAAGVRSWDKVVESVQFARRYPLRTFLIIGDHVVQYASVFWAFSRVLLAPYASTLWAFSRPLIGKFVARIPGRVEALLDLFLAADEKTYKAVYVKVKVALDNTCYCICFIAHACYRKYFLRIPQHEILSDDAYKRVHEDFKKVFKMDHFDVMTLQVDLRRMQDRYNIINEEFTQYRLDNPEGTSECIIDPKRRVHFNSPVQNPSGSVEGFLVPRPAAPRTWYNRPTYSNARLNAVANGPTAIKPATNASEFDSRVKASELANKVNARLPPRAPARVPLRSILKSHMSMPPSAPMQPMMAPSFLSDDFLGTSSPDRMEISSPDAPAPAYVPPPMFS